MGKPTFKVQQANQMKGASWYAYCLVCSWVSSKLRDHPADAELDGEEHQRTHEKGAE